MIQIKPYISTECSCVCGGEFSFSELVWQGLHVCEKLKCERCGTERINSLPVNQSFLNPLTFYPATGSVYDADGIDVKDNWFSIKLKSVSKPVDEQVNIKIEKFSDHKEVLILNTLDYVYGHSLLYLLNLQRLAATARNIGIIVIIQPMMRWLVPENGIAEIWTVQLGFQKFNNYYPDLSEKINSALRLYDVVWLSKGHPIPTNENIHIELFTRIIPYNFVKEPLNRRITFIWREDPDRLWVRNIYLLKGFKKLGFKRLLIPLQFFRVASLFRYLNRKLGNRFTYSVAGLGTFGKFPSFINDNRVSEFNEETERVLCRIYSESLLVIGVHGSNLLLPSAHAGMTLSLMPSKRWGNYAEDLLFTEQDVRLAEFQKRIVPLNLCISDLKDIVFDMVTGRDDFIKKFIHSDEL
jgi:hypothetical protein